MKIFKLKNEKLYKTLFIVLIVLLFMPIVQNNIIHFNIKELNGVTLETEKPKLSFETYKNGSFQRQFDTYLTEKVGFREFFIRTYNQYIWSCYTKTFNDNVSIGKDRWLYSTVNVRDHYQSLIYDVNFTNERMTNKLDNEALRLYKLQEILKEYGVTLFICMLPGKDYVFPEYLPQNNGFDKPEGVHAYDVLKENFKKYGNNHIDINQLFLNWKGNVDFPLFYKTCTHWSNIATVHSSDTILRYMESLSGLNINNISIGKQYRDKARKPDQDLEELLNKAIFTPTVKYQYAEATIIPDSNAVKPKLIAIGDSFFWNMTYVLPMKDLFEYYHYWYYNSTVYFDQRYSNTSQFDLVSELLDSDFVMLSYCTAQIYDLDRKFINNALVRLCYDEDEIQERIGQVVTRMRNSEKWSAEIANKAKNSGRSVDEIMYEDAHYTVFHIPEEYFPELKGDEVPTKRSGHLLSLISSKTL